MSVHYQDIEAIFTNTGLIVRGGFHTSDTEDPASKTIVMIGNAGPEMWEHFEPVAPVDPNPLDAWTKQCVAPLAKKLGAVALHPNDKPYRPFQQWAMRAESVYASPIGILIHPTFGLWHAYRMALVFDEKIQGLPEKTGATNPCDTCERKPCMSTCPVNAFSADGYDVPECVAYLKTPSGRACHDGGCQARMACPVAVEHRYVTAQRAFHGASFFRSNG